GVGGGPGACWLVLLFLVVARDARAVNGSVPTGNFWPRIVTVSWLAGFFPPPVWTGAVRVAAGGVRVTADRPDQLRALRAPGCSLRGHRCSGASYRASWIIDCASRVWGSVDQPSEAATSTMPRWKS